MPSPMIEVDQRWIIPTFCAILALMNCYCKCAAIIGLSDDVFVVASDFVILACLPKELNTTYYNFCTVIICIAQLVRTAVFCSNNLDMEHYVVCYLLLLLLYAYKLYLLVLLLQRFSIRLQCWLLLQGESSVSIFPVTATYFTRRFVDWVDYFSGNLLVLMILIQELESIFLKRRDEVLAEEQDLYKHVHYDENMDITALFITTKNQLQQCQGDYE